MHRSEAAFYVGQLSLDLGLGMAGSLSMMCLIRFSSPGTNNRVITRLASGAVGSTIELDELALELPPLAAKSF